ncbi:MULTISPECIES: flagellar biosynthesis protein FlhA [unclassified Fusibacter]|uniref:flagellar biosynthesis protein FlhA n=1 Tax=unclassified Fusibacter TaxID=2624464 RepID=UPI001010C784|nr:MULTISPECIES: flagellar biosynthesis protein FlhA [unclassified Fusibacter]MCK8058776.1 flagellar biosynthesis protein FlhA [Fusibacter sp. A2]NPE21850.1 flagellar biosynthesis protein FlhA [Fusibacter sp. A1]RXV61422.1 flagellar biosynthesis protein FlhA [Fusibacter sp. A1]
MRFTDILVPIVIVGIIMLIIIPVPSSFIDYLLTVNIATALLILLISMFNQEPLQFSIFPSLLLVTTVFRLALNISTTRLILTEANAGGVIDAFGNFVIQGNAIVGFIIFVIIIIIQFLVITKGSERVSEVAARFTLDAMPGKQMAIDADLNSGLISEADARSRRTKIQREADFYGAMDGASKFVKGDAIAGIIITVINIVAGFVIGAVNFNLTLLQSLQRFTILTVGDGLVSQIPALMISIGTGIVVTRAASEGSLARDMVDQLFATPVVLMIVSGVLFVLGLSPLPTVPLFALSGFFLYIGLTLRSSAKKTSLEEEGGEPEDQGSESEDMRRPENIIPLLQVDPIELEFGYGIIPLADPNQGGDLFDRLVMIRRQIALEFGVIVPMIRLRDNIQLEPNQYNIKIKGASVAYGEILFDHFLAMSPGHVEGEIEGVDTIEPAFGLPAKWIRGEDREKAEILGYTVVDPSSIISTHLTEIIKRHTHELLSRQDVKQLIENVKENNDTLVNELIPSLMSIGDVQKVLANLLREFVSIRDLVSILETLADYASVTRDTNVLTEYVRQSLKRQISGQYIQGKQAKVITLNQDLEDLLMSSIKNGENGTYIALDPRTTNGIINSLAVEIQNLLSLGEQPIVLTAPIVRFYFKQLTESTIPDLIVLSYNEIEGDIDIQSVGVVSI